MGGKASSDSSNKPIQLRLYKFEGAWGPFKVKIPCGECTLTEDIIASTLTHELAGANVTISAKEWLSHWWEPLIHGGWHAPIVLMDNKVISQGDAINRGMLAETVMRAHVKRAALTGTHMFGKDNCGHCDRAKTLLDDAGIAYAYHDVIENTGALYEMLARVKPLIGAKTPVTTPQIWIDGIYIGGAEALATYLSRK